MALKSLALNGVFVGGGMAPEVLAAHLEDRTGFTLSLKGKR